MRKLLFQIVFLIIILFVASLNSFAEITKLQRYTPGGSCVNPACLGSTYKMRLAQGKSIEVGVFGNGLNLANNVRVTGGSGVTAEIYGRGITEGRLDIRIAAGQNAEIGTATIRISYPLTDNEDEFNIIVLPIGTFTSLDRLRRTESGSLVSASKSDIPLGEKAIFRINGTKISSDTRICSSNAKFTEYTVLDSNSNSITLETKVASNLPLGNFEVRICNQVAFAETGYVYEYYYQGSQSVTFVGTSTNTGFSPSPILATGNITTTTFLDASAPTTIGNLFRRVTGTGVFTQKNVNYFQVNNRHCEGLAIPGVEDTTSKLITIPDLTWNVSNLGTANIAANFIATLSSGGVNLQTQTINNILAGGQSQQFTFARPQGSQVRVYRLQSIGGCFINPNADQYFEDPNFTISVDPNNVLNEAATNRNNNIRQY